LDKKKKEKREKANTALQITAEGGEPKIVISISAYLREGEEKGESASGKQENQGKKDTPSMHMGGEIRRQAIPSSRLQRNKKKKKTSKKEEK